MKEEINKKANDDELNKAQDEIGKPPRKFIPVPKPRKNLILGGKK